MHANHSGQTSRSQRSPEHYTGLWPWPAYLHSVRGRLSEFVLVQLQRVSREDVGVLAAHVSKPLEQLWLILSKVKCLHWPRGCVGHHRHPHSGQLVAAAADPLYLTDSIQDDIHLGLKALLTHKHILISGSIKTQNDFQITCW